MAHILAGIMSLSQYKIQYQALPEERPCCPSCGFNGLWRHGCYDRKSDRLNPPAESLNPISIQRYYCPSCKKTCSVLPECISPSRWYLWEMQQIAILLRFLGRSIRSIAQEIKPCRRTVKRWVSWINDNFSLHKDALCTKHSSFGVFTGAADFWKNVFLRLPLSSAMYLCHKMGIAIP